MESDVNNDGEVVKLQQNAKIEGFHICRVWLVEWICFLTLVDSYKYQIWQEWPEYHIWRTSEDGSTQPMEA